MGPSSTSAIYVICVASFDDLTHVEVTECLVERALSAPVQRNNSHSKKAEKMPQINRSTTAGTMQQGSTASASFIVNKPARGWLHPDHLFAKDGINYAVRVSSRLQSSYSYPCYLKYRLYDVAVYWVPGGEHIHEGPGL